jgi:hypothetical protein
MNTETLGTLEITLYVGVVVDNKTKHRKCTLAILRNVTYEYAVHVTQQFKEDNAKLLEDNTLDYKFSVTPKFL